MVFTGRRQASPLHHALLAVGVTLGGLACALPSLAQSTQATTPEPAAFHATVAHKPPVAVTRTAAAVPAKKKDPASLTTPKDAPSENITVTGSYLRSSRGNDPNPVQIIKATDIQKTSASTLGDYLLRLPSIGSRGASNANSTGVVGGLSCADIRNLGPSRVLVLVDGRRLPQTMSSSTMCVDLNEIPTDQIESIEILKDGGSELYGADAVSGVINIKLKHNVDDGAISVKGGLTDVGDDKSARISAHKGFDFAQGRGNITLFGQYMTQGGFNQRDRSWASLASSNDPAPGAPALFGSAITPQTRVDPSGLNLISNNHGGFSKYTSANNYNFGTPQMVYGYLQTSNVSMDAHYTVNDHLTFYTTDFFTRRTFENSPAGVTVQGSGVPSSTLPSSLVLPVGNPYNIFGKNVALYKRFQELGDHALDVDVDTYQFTEGARGRIAGNWKYDLSYGYGASDSSFRTRNDVNYAHLLQELGVQQVTPGSSSSAVAYNPSVCKASAGCVLANPFVPFTGQAAKYIAYTEHESSAYQLRDLNLRINNDSLLKLPYSGGGDVGVAFGLEHRGEQGSYSPDPQVVAGNIVGVSSATTGGGFDATELYAETKFVLLKNVPLARDLSIDAQGRWSNYNTSGGNQTWKASINWAPTRDIRFRGTIGTSYRQPNIYELYGGHTVALSPGADPCANAASYGAKAATVTAKCASQGVNTKNFVSSWSGSIPTISGGNSNLTPEQGRTYTFGPVFTPRWLPGFSSSVEYWHYSVSNTIGTLSDQYILDQCYTGANPALCGSVPARSSSGQLVAVSSTYQNLGGLKTSGIDFDLNYDVRIGPNDSLHFSNEYQQLISYLQQNTPGGAWLNYAGRLLYQSAYGFPRAKDNLSLTWTHGDFSVGYMMTLTGGMRYNNGTTDLTAQTNQYYKVGVVTSHDLTVGYDFGKWSIQAGVNNLFDEQPPYVPSAVFNTASGLYGEEMIGRYVWMQAGVKF